jgi:hypothetical protein
MFMRIFRWIPGGIVLGCVAGACGGNAEQAAPGGLADESGNAGHGGSGSGSTGNLDDGIDNGISGSSGSAADTTTPPVPREPLKHRAVADVCDRERPPGSVSRSYGVAVPDDAETCVTDADCAVPESCAGCLVACVNTGERMACVSARPSSCAADAHCSEGVNGRCEDLRGAVCTYDECFADSECNTGGPCACEGGFWSDSNACLAGNCQTDADCGGYCSPSFGDCGDYAGVIGYYCHTPEDTCLDDADCSGPDTGAGYCMYRPEVAHWACGYGQCVG